MSKKDSYHLILQSKEWAIFRNKIFQRDNFKCVKCRSNNKLNCHHKYYVKGKMPWEYPFSAMMTLCDNCHTLWHENNHNVYKSAETDNTNKTNFKNISNDKIRKMYDEFSPKELELQKRYDKHNAKPYFTPTPKTKKMGRGGKKKKPI